MVPNVEGFPAGSLAKNLSAVQETYAGGIDLIPGTERSPEEGNGNPRQYSCLDNSTYRRAWQATVHGVTKEPDTTYQLNNNDGNFMHSLQFLVEIIKV